MNFDKGIDHLAKSLETRLWIDDSHLNPMLGHQSFDEEATAVSKLLQVVASGSETCAAAAETAIENLAEADMTLAQTAIVQAEIVCLVDACQQEIDRALFEMGRAEEDLAGGDPDKAIGHFRNAWKAAQQAYERS